MTAGTGIPLGSDPEGEGNTETEIAEARKPNGAWLSTPSGIVALVALILSVVLPPLFFPLAGLAFVLGIVALVRRRPRPRSAWVVTIISGVLLLVVLAIGILASIFLFATTEDSAPGVPNPAVTSPAVTPVPAEQP